MKFFNDNKSVLRTRVAALEKEVDEEVKLHEELQHRDANDDVLRSSITAFLSGEGVQAIELAERAAALDEKLRSTRAKNNALQRELASQDSEYRSIVTSEEAKRVSDSIQQLRTTLDSIDLFLVEEGIRGPPSI